MRNCIAKLLFAVILAGTIPTAASAQAGRAGPVRQHQGLSLSATAGPIFYSSQTFDYSENAAVKLNPSETVIPQITGTLWLNDYFALSGSIGYAESDIYLEAPMGDSKGKNGGRLKQVPAMAYLRYYSYSAPDGLTSVYISAGGGLISNSFTQKDSIVAAAFGDSVSVSIDNSLAAQLSVGISRFVTDKVAIELGVAYWWTEPEAKFEGLGRDPLPLTISPVILSLGLSVKL